MERGLLPKSQPPLFRGRPTSLSLPPPTIHLPILYYTLYTHIQYIAQILAQELKTNSSQSQRNQSSSLLFPRVFKPLKRRLVACEFQVTQCVTPLNQIPA